MTVIIHSFLANVLLQRELFDLSFVNMLVGEPWWEPSNEYGFTRAHGIFREPSFLSTYVGIASGLASIRLGLFGSKWRHALRASIPLWAASAILGGLIVSFSAVVYAGFLVACLGILATRTTFSPRSIITFATGSAAAIFVIVILALQAGTVITDRIIGLAVFSQLDGTENATTGIRDNLSVQVLFSNAYVTLRNVMANPLLGAGVGAHPFAYDVFVPTLPIVSTTDAVAIEISAQDASSLALRLLSETGILGTATFSIAVLCAWLRVRNTVLTTTTDRSFKALAVALNGGLAGVSAAMMFRIPNYYAAEFWALFALCAAIPALGASSYFRSFSPVGRS